MVPRFTTALTGPLLELERRIMDNATNVERWLRTHGLAHTPPFFLYSCRDYDGSVPPLLPKGIAGIAVRGLI